MDLPVSSELVGHGRLAAEFTEKLRKSISRISQVAHEAGLRNYDRALDEPLLRVRDQMISETDHDDWYFDAS